MRRLACRVMMMGRLNLLLSMLIIVTTIIRKSTTISQLKLALFTAQNRALERVAHSGPHIPREPIRRWFDADLKIE